MGEAERAAERIAWLVAVAETRAVAARARSQPDPTEAAAKARAVAARARSQPDPTEAAARARAVVARVRSQPDPTEAAAKARAVVARRAAAAVAEKVVTGSLAVGYAQAHRTRRASTEAPCADGRALSS